jgi:serine/threonine protein kinase/Tol biopolymer transport system component
MIGKTVSHYKILDKLGEGGMGVVYKAQDTKLGREVALKTLPEEFAQDVDRVARFKREAKLLASLSHPNIAAIHGLEEEEDLRFLVLEMVEGETLAGRLHEGALGIEEALGICAQIAEALEAAHEKGIIHRDLKPGNVKITPEGRIKVLDFGLAKAFESMDSGEKLGVDLSKSPTLTVDRSGSGVILGTAPYMSPEQARGKPLDKRTDIWSFGCVLYELLSGRRAFEGETVTDIVAAIIKGDPDWEGLPEETPRSIRTLLRRCLQKDPRRRLHDIADARIEIEECRAEPRVPVRTPAPATKRRLLPILVTAAVTALVAGIAVWNLRSPDPPSKQSAKRFKITLPATDELAVGAGLVGPALALSRDGANLVYVGKRGGVDQLYLRPMNEFEATQIPGTEGARQPFFSPDGQWIAFFAERKLKKVPLAGGVPLNVCDASGTPVGGSWAPSDIIIFGLYGSPGLLKVPAGGGMPESITTVDLSIGEQYHRWPELIPDAGAFLFTIIGTEASSIAVQSLETGEKRILIKDASTSRLLQPRYASSGHIVFEREGSLLAVPFDPDRLEIAGSAFPVLEGVRREGQFRLSSEGALVYIGGEMESTEGRTLVRVDRQGIAQPLTETRRRYLYPRYSPDGKRLAVAINDPPPPDIWILELERDVLSRFTFSEGRASILPLWSPDGSRIVFSSDRIDSRLRLFSKPVDGRGSVEQLMKEALLGPTSFSSDGKTVIFTQSGDIGMLRLDGERRPEMILETPYREHSGMLSPDDQWLAYVSNESGREEVYVRSFPSLDRKWQVSREGGMQPVWAPSGQELFYRNEEKMMAVAITTEPDFSAQKPILLFEGHYLSWSSNPDYEISPDGQHFVMIHPEKQSVLTQINIILDWLEELERLVPEER